jgi:hypothetical protein
MLAILPLSYRGFNRKNSTAVLPDNAHAGRSGKLPASGKLFPFPQPTLRVEMVHFVTPPHLTLSEG